MYGHRNLQKSSKIYVLLLFYKVKLCKKLIFCKFRFSLISVHLLTQFKETKQESKRKLNRLTFLHLLKAQVNVPNS